MDEPMFSVIDTLAENGDRQHEIPDPTTGKLKRFKFQGLTPTACPRFAAVIFASIPTFDVTDPDGNPFKIAPEALEEARKLAPDEIIARYSELTQDALLARCVATGQPTPGLNKSTKKEALIGFLLRHRATAPADRPAADSDEIDLELADAA